MNRDEVNVIVATILSAAYASEGHIMPLGHIYMALQTMGVGFDQFNAVIELLVVSKLIVRTSETLTLTPTGVELGGKLDKIYEEANNQ